jgi:hypothetical protein
VDYCTLWFEGWWAYCCAAHDAAYASGTVRMLADLALQNCVASSASGWLAGISALIAGLMFFFVRLLGGFFYRRAQRDNKTK